MIDRRIGLAGWTALALVLSHGAATAQTPPAGEAPATAAPTEAPAETTPAAPETPPAADVEAVSSPDVVTTAGEDPVAAVENISPAIGDVQVVGPWSEGERRGHWRVVMVQSPEETTGNRLFIQQIEVSPAGFNVAATTEIEEVAEIEGAIVGYRADEPSEGQESNLALFFDIVPLDGEIAETYELFFTPGAPYIFGPASN